MISFLSNQLRVIHTASIGLYMKRKIKTGEIHSTFETTLSELVTMILPQAVSRQIITIQYKSFMLTRLLQTLSFIRNIVFCELSPSELLLKPYIVNDDWTEANI